MHARPAAQPAYAFSYGAPPPGAEQSRLQPPGAATATAASMPPPSRAGLHMPAWSAADAADSALPTTTAPLRPRQLLGNSAPRPGAPAPSCRPRH